MLKSQMIGSLMQRLLCLATLFLTLIDGVCSFSFLKARHYRWIG